MTVATAAALPARGLRAVGSDDKWTGSTSANGARSAIDARPDALVPRPRLISRLVEASGAPLAVITGAAGYGKTTLLWEWARRDPRPFAWVRVEDEGASGQARLVESIEHALEALAAPEPAVHASRARSRPGAPPAGIARLVRSLGAHRPFVLVLDDFHLLEGAPSLELIGSLAQHLPSGCQLALATRTVPGLPLARLRANRTMTELRSRDLAMTATEGAVLLARAGLELAPSCAEALVRRTEGWPAALYLAAVQLRDESDVGVAVAGFAGDDAIVSDYLRDEVLSRLDVEAVSFLTRASILDRLSGPVCDAVLQRHGSARLLSALGRVDALLVPLDRKDEAYRPHRLLCDMLRADLRRLHPKEVPLLHSRASAWYSAHAEVDRAAHHAVASGDVGRAADLLRARAPEYVTQRRVGTLRRWLSSFTAEQMSAHPALALAAANSHLMHGELDAVQRLESAARRALRETPAVKRSAALEANVALLQAILARDGVLRMGEDAARAYDLEPEDSPWRSLCCLLEGVAKHLTGDRDAAEQRLEEGVRRAAVAAPNVQTLCLAQLVLLAAEREEWETGASMAARARAQVEHYSLAGYPSSALVFAASAVVRARRGRVEEAQSDLREGKRLLELLTDFMPWYEAETRVALARTATRLSDATGARTLVADAARLARRTPEATVLHEWIEDASVQAGAACESACAPTLLTTAELRILSFLPTHLSFREIAGRLYVSANTVKTQAHAVYRKLGVGSRTEAVARATQIGLLDL